MNQTQGSKFSPLNLLNTSAKVFLRKQSRPYKCMTCIVVDSEKLIWHRFNCFLEKKFLHLPLCLDYRHALLLSGSLYITYDSTIELAFN